MKMPVNLQHAENATKTEKSNFNRLVRCQEFKIISTQPEIRNQHVKMRQIPSMEEKSATSSAKPVSLMCRHLKSYFGDALWCAVCTT